MVVVAPSPLARVHHISGLRHLRGWWCPATLIASVLAAYAVPLAALVHQMGYDTPLAYLGLVPPIAFALGCWRYHRTGAAPAPLAPRDAVMGGLLLLLTAFVNAGVPVLVAPATWSRPIGLAAFPRFAASARLDLLSLPLFAAGVLILLYDTSALRWAWPALGYGLLVWPVPYTLLLGHVLPLISAATAWATDRASMGLPLGATVAPEDATLFTIATPHGPQTVSIGTVCSGFNSFVAWLLIGVAVCIIVRARHGGANRLHTSARLLRWLLLGGIATFLGNIVRIALLFAVIHHAGLDATFDVVHALLGNALFDVVVLGMLGLLPRFGLALPQPARALHEPSPSQAPASPPAVAQISLLVVMALALATGMLLNVTILRLTLVVLVGYLLLGLSLLAVSTRSRLMDHGTPHLRTTTLALISVLLAIGSLALIWYLGRMRTDQLPSLGWRIDQLQQALVTGRARRIMTLVSTVATIAAGCFAARTLRGRVVAMQMVGRQWLPPWSAAAFAAGAIIVGTVTLCISTATVASFTGDIVATGGAPQADFDAALPAIAAATPAFVETYDWMKQSLGKTATYNRYRYDVADGRPLWADVLTTEDADALAYHSVRTCYAFHGYVDRGTLPLDIGNGVMAWIITYTKPDVDETWSALYWEQQITRSGKTFSQRIVLLSNVDLPPGDVTASRVAPSNEGLQADARQLFGRLRAQGRE